MTRFADQIILSLFAQKFLAERKRRTGLIGCVLFFSIILALSGFSQTAWADGNLDPTFGTGGKVITDVSGGVDYLRHIVLQSDGKIVAVGFADINLGGSKKIELVRYNADGTLDATFGNGGKVITDIPSVVYATANSVVIQPDGKIITAGSATLPTVVDTSFLLVRYNTNGTIDTTFGNGGIVLTNIGDNRDSAESVALQTDGKIVAVGEKGIFRPPGEERNTDIALVRYNTDGSVDSSFGIGGTVVSDFGPSPGNFADDANVVIIQPDGRIVIAGDSDGGGYYDFLVARYSSNGMLDTTFGNGGRMKNDLGNGFQDGASAAARQPDGKIVSVGTALPNSLDLDFALIRYNTNGSLDTTFGNGGKVVFGLESIRDEVLTAVAIEQDGKIVALGDSNSSANSGFLLLRFNRDGTLDSSFGNGGIVRTPFNNNATQTASLIIQPDTRIVAAGFTPLYQTSDFALARYLAPSLSQSDFDPASQRDN